MSWWFQSSQASHKPEDNIVLEMEACLLQVLTTYLNPGFLPSFQSWVRRCGDHRRKRKYGCENNWEQLISPWVQVSNIISPYSFTLLDESTSQTTSTARSSGKTKVFSSVEQAPNIRLFVSSNSRVTKTKSSPQGLLSMRAEGNSMPDYQWQNLPCFGPRRLCHLLTKNKKIRWEDSCPGYLLWMGEVWTQLCF